MVTASETSATSRRKRTSTAERARFVVDLVRGAAAPPTREELLRAIGERFAVSRRTAWTTLDVALSHPSRIAVRGGRFLPVEKVREFVAALELARSPQVPVPIVPPQVRDIAIAMHRDGASCADIAEVLGLEETTVQALVPDAGRGGGERI